MSYNFINEAAQIRTSPLCYYDTINAYASNFNINGDTNGWDYYDGIHTYGCWDGFIFATLYSSYALIGRTTVFSPAPAEDYYLIKITMKINPVERVSSQVLPTKARVMWVTTSDSTFNTTKSYDFDIEADNEWHVYILNMGELQYWQGDVTNLRLYPIYEDGRAGDEFFIKSIKISSVSTYRCDNVNCSYYNSYEHPCPGIGTKGYCKSSTNSSDYYTVEEDVNDELIININNYGNETIKIDPISNATGPEIAKKLVTNISRVGIGGYSEVEIDYTEDKEFVIYSGTYTTTSTVIIADSSLARTLNFFDSGGNDISSKTTGTLPATGAESASSFKIKAFQTLSLFDNDDTTSFTFDPFMYNVEGGRRDWAAGGLGVSDAALGTGEYTQAANTTTRTYNIIDNANKTIIDFNHPFNTSGRVKKIYAACTLDQGYESVSSYPPATSYEGRLEATGCKVLILRPRRNGNLEVIHSIDIPDRDYSGGKLYSYYQESIDLDCDIWVNKGDLIGIYNANVYVGKSISGDQIDALYYHVSGQVSGEFDPGGLYGDGISGLLFYARSEKVQDKLVLDIDLGNRVNIEDINVVGSVENTFLEYNIARCLDVNWSVDLFDQAHQTGYTNLRLGLDYNQTYTYEHLNVAYGIDKLSDGVTIVPDGYAGSGYTVGDESVGGAYSGDYTTTFVVADPQYFFVNGDQEWLGIYQHKRSSYAAKPFVQGFNDDPAAFTLLFPYGLDKDIYKSVVYFKEKYNFRNFALSVVYDVNDVLGDADDNRFHYIEDYTAVTIDNQRIEKDGRGYDSVNYYLFANPSVGVPDYTFTGQRTSTGGYIGKISNYEENFQASNLDWTYLSHEFEPITCKGFRFYCDYHYSTKIMEMELYCRAEDLGSNLVGGMSTSYSYYGDLWWQAPLEQTSDNLVTIDINDTPRYFTVEIEPITKMTLNEIIFSVRDNELYIGEKGCDYQVLPVSSKADVDNTGQTIEIKNIYNSDYDLYVDIANDTELEGRLIYHTKLNSEESILDPEIGPDGSYNKSDDYPLVGYYKNCAINCDCWGLRNLIDGKQAYYSYDNGYTWTSVGTLSSGVSIDFSNVSDGDTSKVIVPILSRNRYWKVVWLAGDHPAMNIREMIPFYEDEEVDCVFYHEKTLPFEDGPISDTAPHLRNVSVVGSYYELDGTTSIGLDLGAQESFDELVLFHDSILDYNQLYCGIDKYTMLNLTVRDFDVVDYSYYERPITINNAEADTGKWDFDFNEVTTVSGLIHDSDTAPTSSTLSDEPDFVDGVLYDPYVSGNPKDSTANNSHGIDLGEPKKVHRLRFYITGYASGVLTGGWLSSYTWHIYKSNDNVSWQLAHKTTSNPKLTLVGGYDLWFDLYLPLGPPARYFKLWHSGTKVLAGNNQYYQCNEIKAYVEEPNSYKTGIGFEGDYNSYISVPASSDFSFPGTSQDFNIDFDVKFNSLPVASGNDYCNLLRNWDDPVTTVKFGDISYPPENWMGGAIMEQGGVGSPYANYAVFVRSNYNLALMEGATYSTDTSPNLGNAASVFDGDSNNTYIGWFQKPFPIGISCTLPTAKKITRYGISGYATIAGREINSWSLQGYITASGTWVDLHSVSNHGDWTQYEMEYWDFVNPYDACTQYRLSITANRGDSYTFLYELELFDDIDLALYQMEIWFSSYNPAGYYGGTQHRWDRLLYEVEEGGSYNVSIRTPTNNSIDVHVNGEKIGLISMLAAGLISHSEDLVIAGGLDGVISDLRITKGIVRTDYLPRNWHPNERYYTLSLYVSEDNIAYGKYCDIDLYSENSYSYYYSDNVFSSDYYSKLAIDLGNRYDIELIRSYGDSDTQPFSIYGENSTDIYYSNDEVSDVKQVTWFTRDDYDNTKTLWTSEYYVSVNCPNVATISRSFTAVDCTGLTKENGMLVIDISCTYYPNNLDTTRPSKIQISSSAGTGSEEWYYILTKVELEILTDGEYHTFYLPLKYFDTTGGELNVSNINYVRMYYYCKQSADYLYLYWKNAKVVWSLPEAIAVADDARWLRFDLLSGDGTDRNIRKLGVYPDISTQLSPAGGHYNHEWDYLGKSITAYESSTNLALGATTSGSSYFGIMNLTNLTDGIINSAETTDISTENASFYNVWGSDDEASPWVYVDLGAVYNIYRFKIYHGYDGVDTDYLITDYEVQTSTDNQTYTTHFTIADNDSFERTHDLVIPVQARYVRIAITGYDSRRILLRTDLELDSLDFFEGAVIREIEVYEYYGYPVISSEEYPIVAINMADQFYLSSHSIVGVDTEDTSGDWINEDHAFCYSDSVLDNPSKVDFREWAGIPGYDRWAVVKMDTATDYRGGPHYLKHARITSSEDQNSCNYPWWWQSSVSTISRDYSYDVVNSISSLKIEYPASTSIDDVSFIEGDNFGTDTLASWRDGFSFRFRIDDIENLDRSYGYFYLGGYDASTAANPIEYRWYISTLSGSLTSGWNNLFLRFKQADEIDYIEDAQTTRDTRIVRTINLGTMGFIYKGIGNEITMHLDGFRIERNRFYDYSAHDVGCYLNNDDFITAPVGEYDMSRGTIEFWLRADYDYNATDVYGTLRNRAIFSFNNNANDVFGFMIAYNGLQIYFGNTAQTLNAFSLSDLGISILDTMFHVGLVFSNDGRHISSDGSTFRLYFNNQLVFKAYDTWEVIDNKHFTFILGGTAPLNLKAGTYIETASLDAVVSDFKIYNYCKTDFYNSMRNMEDQADKLIKPSNLIEISKDNLTYYKVGDLELPFVYNNVPAGNSIPVYVRTNIPKGLTGKEERSAGLLVYWDISV